jgi:hypothetical protein
MKHTRYRRSTIMDNFADPAMMSLREVWAGLQQLNQVLTTFHPLLEPGHS